MVPKNKCVEITKAYASVKHGRWDIKTKEKDFKKRGTKNKFNNKTNAIKGVGPGLAPSSTSGVSTTRREPNPGLWVERAEPSTTVHGPSAEGMDLLQK